MPVERLGIVGAGTMGGGIAEVAVLHGCPMVLYDIEDSIVAAAEASSGLIPPGCACRSTRARIRTSAATTMLSSMS